MDEGEIANDEPVMSKSKNLISIDTLDLMNATEKPRLGFEIYDVDSAADYMNSVKCTLGACVFDDSRNYGIITTAHNIEVDDRIAVHSYYNGAWVNGTVGSVTDRRLGGKLDAALIMFDKNSGFEPTSFVKNGLYLDSSTLPYTGVDCYICGSQNESTVEIVDGHITIMWNDPDSGDVKTYRDMIKMEYKSINKNDKGDSGAPIILDWGDGEYSLVGIFKGTRTQNGTVVAFGTGWENIEDYFDVRMIRVNKKIWQYMKRVSCIILSIIFILINSCCIFAGNAELLSIVLEPTSNNIIINRDGETSTITYSGEKIFIDDNNRVQIPLRYVKDILQEPELLVDWDEDTKTAELYYKYRNNKDIVAAVNIDSNIIKTAWGNEEMDSVPTVKNDRIFVPLRYVLNSLLIDDSSIQWDNKTNTINIKKYSYSEEELNRAFEFLESNMKEFELTGCGVIWRRNCIELSAYEWTEEKKDKIKELTGVNRIIFDIDNNMDTDF